MGRYEHLTIIRCGVLLLLAAGSSFGAGISYSLERSGTPFIVTGTPITIDIRATFAEPLSAGAFRLMASGEAGATFTARSANPGEANGLTFISTVQQSPYQNGLPLNLKTTPSVEVLADLDHKPPAQDGLAPGSNVLIERITIIPSGVGLLVISLSEASGITTQGAAEGLLLEPVSYGLQSMTLTIVAPPGCKNPRYDADGDKDVDQVDFATFQRCMTAPGDLYGEFNPDPCLCLDKNNDRAIDIVDYQAFQLCVSGPSIPANAACDD